MKRLFFILMSLVLISCYNKKMQQSNSYENFSGNIRDSTEAIKIAISKWLPIYGKKIYRSKPFKAKMKNDSVWIVTGSLRKNRLGGVPYIELDRFTAKVLTITHTK
jgi:hypothetical protein